MGRIARLQKDISHLQAKLADNNRDMAHQNRHISKMNAQWDDPAKVESRLKELVPSVTITHAEE